MRYWYVDSMPVMNLPNDRLWTYGETFYFLLPYIVSYVVLLAAGFPLIGVSLFIFGAFRAALKHNQ